MYIYIYIYIYMCVCVCMPLIEIQYKNSIINSDIIFNGMIPTEYFEFSQHFNLIFYNLCCNLS
jgi:hypothetical protein